MGSSRAGVAAATGATERSPVAGLAPQVGANLPYARPRVRTASAIAAAIDELAFASTRATCVAAEAVTARARLRLPIPHGRRCARAGPLISAPPAAMPTDVISQAVIGATASPVAITLLGGTQC